VDGYAVLAKDTFGASETLPAYLRWGGEVPMGRLADRPLRGGEVVTVHTGGNLPEGADAVVMIEHTHRVGEDQIEILRPVAVGENVIQIGEDVEAGDLIFRAGHRLRAADIGALMAVGISEVAVSRRPHVAIFATGDEVIPPDATPSPGQIRDINSTMVAGLVEGAGGLADLRGILPDHAETIYQAVSAATAEGADMVVLSAGSSVSVRDMTAGVFDRLGKPGVLVHGIATRPGKPTILAAAAGLPLVGLPGNPVSAYVQFVMAGLPAIAHLMGENLRPARTVSARLTTNLNSSAGREDYVPARLETREGETWAEPIFFKSNLIFTLSAADALIRVPLNATGLEAGARVDVLLL
jgi:molybdopterin molybdotransferase